MSDPMVHGFFTLSAGVLGMSIGSFLNVTIVRWAEDQSILPPSACPHCGHGIRARDLIPVVSWLLLWGKCRDCGTAISPRYPLIEAMTGLVAVLVFWRFIPDYAALDWAHGSAFVVYFAFFCALITGIYVDIRYQILPDQVTIYSVPFALAGLALLQALGFDGFPTVHPLTGLAGGLFIAGILWAAALVGRFVLRIEGMGWGDIKLALLIGIMVGFLPGAWAVVIMATGLGTLIGLLHWLVHRRRTYLPFGPSLALAAMFYVLWGDSVLPYFLPTLMRNDVAVRHLFGL